MLCFSAGIKILRECYLIQHYRLHPAVDAIWVGNFDLDRAAAKTAHGFIIFPIAGFARLDARTNDLRLQAEDIPGGAEICPGCGTSQPGGRAFPSAALHDLKMGPIVIYNGGADTVTALAYARIDEFVDFVKTTSEL